eukprot:TRINITY_DN24756_c0_g1_i1.p2 TRINITY_DN24756_c0_g1~~TRINITY_DN24756_c0_g1_i1.p2  ORF type:complete len:208 (+),score=81.15 TRINITY_DN24756_c0_g1_i1:136-759(+)
MEDVLAYRKAGLTDYDLEAVGAGLAAKGCPTRSVDLSFNEKVGDVGVFYVARGLRFNTSVRTLKLDGTGMTDKGLGVVGKALERNTTLTALSAKGTKITADGVRAFSQCLALHNDTLRTFDTAPHLPRCAALPKAPPDTTAVRDARLGKTWTSAYFPKPPQKRAVPTRQQAAWVEDDPPPPPSHGAGTPGPGKAAPSTVASARSVQY